MTKEHHSAGGVLINRENKVYLIHKISRDEWLLPKGTVEKNENLSETAIREVKEETGYTNIELLLTEPIAKTKFPYKEPDTGITVNKYVTYYLFKVENSNSVETTEQMTKEELEGSWFDIEDAISKVSFEELKDTLRKAQILLP